jgi:hypothetical protein
MVSLFISLPRPIRISLFLMCIDLAFRLQPHHAFKFEMAHLDERTFVKSSMGKYDTHTSLRWRKHGSHAINIYSVFRFLALNEKKIHLCWCLPSCFSTHSLWLVEEWKNKKTSKSRTKHYPRNIFVILQGFISCIKQSNKELIVG